MASQASIRNKGKAKDNNFSFSSLPWKNARKLIQSLKKLYAVIVYITLVHSFLSEEEEECLGVSQLWT